MQACLHTWSIFHVPDTFNNFIWIYRSDVIKQTNSHMFRCIISCCNFKISSFIMDKLSTNFIIQFILLTNVQKIVKQLQLTDEVYIWRFAKSGGDDCTLPSTIQSGILLPSGRDGNSSKEHMTCIH